MNAVHIGAVYVLLNTWIDIVRTYLDYIERT